MGGALVSTRDLLERWRPSATPGAPAAAGVPADRVAERSAELEVVLSLLADAQSQADRIRADALAEAARRRAAAHEQGHALINEAHRRAKAERSAAAAAAHAAGQESAQQIMDSASREAGSMAQRARDREPAVVARIVAQAREEILATAGAATP